jgi:hypothetical protein
VTSVARFPYHFHGEQALVPYIPIFLESKEQLVPSVALLDSGASIDVIPQFIGHQLNRKLSPSEISFRLGDNK